MKPSTSLRGTINTIRTKVRAKLPKKLDEIDFKLKDFLPYTVTSENEMFLPYDNTDNRPKKRLKSILIC